MSGASAWTVLDQTSRAVSSGLDTIRRAAVPASEGVNRGFQQVTQLARERVGGEKDVTVLPEDYRQLEDKVDKIKLITEKLLLVTRTYTLPHNDYAPPVVESATDIANSIAAGAATLFASAQRVVGAVQPTAAPMAKTDSTQIPKSLAHAFSKIALDGANVLSDQDPFAAALKKFAKTQERLGDAKLKLDADITNRVYKEQSSTLNNLVGNAMRARRNVHAVRLAYDAARAKLKASRPEVAERARVEMEKAEDEFVAAVDDAMGKMKTVIESPEPLKNLADLAAAQLAYFKTADALLSELSPEIDELQVTNEALLRRGA
ncbi:hypothetical protein SeMB42_g07603 [Synchytrium endobioticum]|uniref:BAR domain-containing protein n=1 Tax=Synchytrium endobioticum TaxID=286115 RepID=A0A507CZI4_9FUNG|nr:hypothetical protein SeMB42_g07603 [Synchytrium endobioticum]TPX44574.1 hypothetical protein SeLEV6574_g04413 [Synchytrium endobioticum]